MVDESQAIKAKGDKIDMRFKMTKNMSFSFLIFFIHHH